MKGRDEKIWRSEYVSDNIEQSFCCHIISNKDSTQIIDQKNILFIHWLITVVKGKHQTITSMISIILQSFSLDSQLVLCLNSFINNESKLYFQYTNTMSLLLISFIIENESRRNTRRQQSECLPLLYNKLVSYWKSIIYWMPTNHYFKSYTSRVYWEDRTELFIEKRGKGMKRRAKELYNKIFI